MGENDQSPRDLARTPYQFVHVWDPMGVGAGGTAGHVPEMQAGPSGLSAQAGPSGLGLHVPVPGTSRYEALGDPGVGGNLGTMGGQAGLDAHSFDMMSFSGTPISSSTSPYSIPNEGANESMWGEPSLFD